MTAPMFGTVSPIDLSSYVEGNPNLRGVTYDHAADQRMGRNRCQNTRQVCMP